MKTAKTPAAANGKAASPASSTAADRAFLAQGQRFLATLRAAAKSAGVPLDEFLLRAAFEDDRTKKKPEASCASVPFIRAAVRHNAPNARWTSEAIVGHATCDMTNPAADGGPSRHLPAAFRLAPDTQMREDARWLCYTEFCYAWSLPCWADDETGGKHVGHLREIAPGLFTVRLEGITDATRYPVEWAPLSVVSWFFGVEPKFLDRHIRTGRLAASEGDERALSLAAVSALLEWLSKPRRGEAPPAVPMPEDARELYHVAEEALRDQRRRGFHVIGSTAAA